MKSWLDRCESVCCPDTGLLSADKVKLRNELHNVQVTVVIKHGKQLLGYGKLL